MGKKPEYVSRLLEILESLDLHIAERKRGLEIRRSMKPVKTEDEPSHNIHVLGAAETLAAWEMSKSYILNTFPEIEKYYKGPSDEIKQLFGDGSKGYKKRRGGE